jgi:hypothetical protein
MPSKEEWIKIHAELMAKLGLPCKLEFSSEPKVGSHSFEDDHTCVLRVNLAADFRVPEHLILHEAAHHRVCENLVFVDLNDAEYEQHYCHLYSGEHCDHWAKVLCDMYEETGTPLPSTTSFCSFAKLAGITRKNFEQEK